MTYEILCQGRDIQASYEPQFEKMAVIFGLDKYRVMDTIVKPVLEKGFLDIGIYRVRVYISVKNWYENTPTFSLMFLIEVVQ